MAAIPQLKELCLVFDSSKMQSETLVLALSALTGLVSLELSLYLPNPAAELSTLTRLTRLDVAGCENLYSLPFAGALSHLQELSVPPNIVEYDGLIGLTALSSLSMQVQRFGFWPDAAYPQQLQDLQISVPSHYTIEDVDLVKLQMYSRLTRLALKGSEMVPDIGRPETDPVMPALRILETDILVNVALLHWLLHAAPNLREYKHTGWLVMLTREDLDNLEASCLQLHYVCSRLPAIELVDLDQDIANMASITVDAEGITIQEQMALVQALQPLSALPHPRLTMDLKMPPSVARALALAVPNLEWLDLYAAPTSASTLEQYARLQNLQALYLLQLPDPAAESIHIIEAMGHHLTYLIVGVPETGGLGLPPWLNKSRPPTLPALKALQFYNDAGWVSVSDLHYLLHAAPNLVSPLYSRNGEDSMVSLCIMHSLPTDPTAKNLAGFVQEEEEEDQGLVEEFLTIFKEVVQKLASLQVHSLELSFEDASGCEHLVEYLEALGPLSAVTSSSCTSAVQYLGLFGMSVSDQGDPRAQSSAQHAMRFNTTAVRTLLRTSPSLQSLTLQDMQVDGVSALPKLRGLTSLTELVINSCSGLREGHVMALSSKVPHLEVLVRKCDWWSAEATTELRRMRRAYR